jgi:hypothetical protein
VKSGLLGSIFLTSIFVGSRAPESVVRALKIAKSRHKYQVLSKPSGAQRVFFSLLWERIHSESFVNINGLRIVEMLDEIVELNSLKTAKLLNVVSSEEYSNDTIDSSRDFEVVLDLLRMNPTPNSNKIFDSVPDIDITPVPFYQSFARVPSASEINGSGDSNDPVIPFAYSPQQESSTYWNGTYLESLDCITPGNWPSL